MNPLVPVSLAAALVAGAAMVAIVHRVPWSAEVARVAAGALAATLAAVITTTVAGTALAAAQPGFLVGVTSFCLPVAVLIEAATRASGAGRGVRGTILLVWAIVVVPVAALGPALATAACATTQCAVEDFGGALPLVVSAAAVLLPAALLRGMHPSVVVWSAAVAEAGARAGGQPERAGRGSAIVGVLGFWGAFVVWLASLEGAIDAFVPRLLVAAAVVPAASVVGWVVVDRLRGTGRPVARSAALGLLVGMAAAIPGAATVGLPWSAFTGALAGALGALVCVRPGAAAYVVPRIALAVLVAALVGFLSPAISGDTVGVIFSARASALALPVAVFAAVVMFAAAVATPVWLAARRTKGSGS